MGKPYARREERYACVGEVVGRSSRRERSPAATLRGVGGDATGGFFAAAEGAWGGHAANTA